MRPRIKICGLTRHEDIRLARELGADFFGVVLYADSPRFMAEGKVEQLLAVIPHGKRVAVEVAPSPGRLKHRRDQGFDFLQVHYDPKKVSEKEVEGWSKEVGVDRLWLAPHQPPGEVFPATALKAAQTLLVDTFKKGAYGGTGRTGDWTHFRALAEKHPKHRWILSGGLRPENVRAALKSTGAKIIDVNSGVESAPGIKDAVLLDLLFANLAAAE